MFTRRGDITWIILARRANAQMNAFMTVRLKHANPPKIPPDQHARLDAKTAKRFSETLTTPVVSQFEFFVSSAAISAATCCKTSGKSPRLLIRRSALTA